MAGSNTWSNYRHQADISHAYQLLRRNGVPAENIINFQYDDIAQNSRNPFPGQIFNAPTSAGESGVDVYKGQKIDYRGSEVTPKNFLAALTGNSSVVAGKPVLKSTANDNVFIYFSDHGAPNLIAFPSEYLYSDDLLAALKYMYTNRMYKKMVFYLEACESGSMFEGILPNDWNIYATTAANAHESSWGYYCPPNDQVNGRSIGSCLGDLYSINFLENSDSAPLSETLEEQYVILKNLTDKSHVMQYGDLSWTNEPIGNYIAGSGKTLLGTEQISEQQRERRDPSQGVNSRDVPMHLAYYRYLRAPIRTAESKEALAELRQQLDAREAAISRFEHLSSMLVESNPRTGRKDASALFAPVTPGPVSDSQMQCIKMGVETLKRRGCDYDDFSLQFHNVIVNYCKQHQREDELMAATQFIMQAATKVCF